MINRAKMPRQLRDKGGIASVTPREKYGLGSKLKERFRKLIPNELADIAVKAAPFVAPFNPGIAGLMRGIGRFDQRGSISDAFKQGVGTFAFGAGTRALGGADPFGGGLKGGFTSPLSADRTTAIKDLFSGTEGAGKTDVANVATKSKDVGTGFMRDATGLFKDVPILKDLPSLVQQQILVGGVTSAATYIYQAFLADEPPQQEGETYEEYMTRRRENVGRKMESYFDNYFKFDKEYSSMTDEQKKAFIDRVNIRDGGRAGYQTGGITMANTLAENIRRNLANQAAVAQQFRQARRNIPGYVEPVVPPAPKAAPIKIEEPDLPISKPIQPPGGDVQPLLPVMPGQPGLFPQPSKPDNFIERVIPQDPGPGGIDRLLPDLYEKVVGPAPEQPSIPPRVVTKPVDIVDLYEKVVGPAEPPVAPPLTDEEILEERELNPPTPPFFPTLPVEPMTDQQILEGYAKYRQENPDAGAGVGIQVIINGVLPDGTPLTFRNGAEAAAFNQYLESIGQPPFKRVRDIDPQKLAGGGMPTGVMTTNKAGVMERDYRDKGGFVPVGIKEKADDVPAMLSKNEFVFTADAVRGAGNGSIEKGAQRMYDTMKKLEKRVV
jgi:hypothetical protein